MQTAIARPRFAIGDRVRVTDDSLRNHSWLPRSAGTVIAIEERGTVAYFEIKFDDKPKDATYRCFAWMLVSADVVQSSSRTG